MEISTQTHLCRCTDDPMLPPAWASASGPPIECKKEHTLLPHRTPFETERMVEF